MNVCNFLKTLFAVKEIEVDTPKNIVYIFKETFVSK